MEEFDKDLNFDEIDKILEEGDSLTLDIDTTENVNSGEPISIIKASISNVVEQELLNVNKISKNILSGLKGALPSDVSSIIDTSENVVEETISNLEEFTTGVRKTVAGTIGALGSIAPDFISEPLNRLKEWIYSPEDVTGSSVNKEPSEDEKIKSEVAELFSKFSLENLSASIQQRESVLISKQTNELLAIGVTNLEKLLNFKTAVELPYYRRSLELQIKQTLLLSKLFIVTKKSFEVFDKKFEAIVHNTSLPDFAKASMGDFLKQSIMTTLVEGGMGLFKSNSLVKNIGERITGLIKDKVYDFLSANEQITDTISSIKDIISMGEEFGYSKEQMLLEFGLSTAIESGSEKLIKYLISKASEDSKLRKYIGDIRKLEDDPAKAVKRIADAIEKYKKENPEDEDRNTNKFISYFNKVRGKLLEGTANFIKGLGEEEFGINNLNIVRTENLSKTTTLDNKFKLTVEKVIPGLLSRILQEVTAIRKGSRRVDERDLVYFDFNKNRFVTHYEIKRAFGKKVREEPTQFYKRLYNKSIFKTLLGYTPTDKEMRILTDALANYLMDGKSPSPFFMYEEGLHTYIPDKELSKKVEVRLRKLATTQLSDDEIDKLKSLTGMLRSTLTSSTVTFQKDVLELEKIGAIDVAREFSIVNKDNATRIDTNFLKQLYVKQGRSAIKKLSTSESSTEPNLEDFELRELLGDKYNEFKNKLEKAKKKAKNYIKTKYKLEHNIDIDNIPAEKSKLRKEVTLELKLKELEEINKVRAEYNLPLLKETDEIKRLKNELVNNFSFKNDDKILDFRNKYINKKPLKVEFVNDKLDTNIVITNKNNKPVTHNGFVSSAIVKFKDKTFFLSLSKVIKNVVTDKLEVFNSRIVELLNSIRDKICLNCDEPEKDKNLLLADNYEIKFNKLDSYLDTFSKRVEDSNTALELFIETLLDKAQSISSLNLPFNNLNILSENVNNSITNFRSAVENSISDFRTYVESNLNNINLNLNTDRIKLDVETFVNNTFKVVEEKIKELKESDNITETIKKDVEDLTNTTVNLVTETIDDLIENNEFLKETKETVESKVNEIAESIENSDLYKSISEKIEEIKDTEPVKKVKEEVNEIYDNVSELANKFKPNIETIFNPHKVDLSRVRFYNQEVLDKFNLGNNNVFTDIRDYNSFKLFGINFSEITDNLSNKTTNLYRKVTDINTSDVKKIFNNLKSVITKVKDKSPNLIETSKRLKKIIEDKDGLEKILKIALVKLPFPKSYAEAYNTYKLVFFTIDPTGKLWEEFVKEPNAIEELQKLHIAIIEEGQTSILDTVIDITNEATEGVASGYTKFKGYLVKTLPKPLANIIDNPVTTFLEKSVGRVKRSFFAGLRAGSDEFSKVITNAKELFIDEYGNFRLPTIWTLLRFTGKTFKDTMVTQAKFLKTFYTELFGGIGDFTKLTGKFLKQFLFGGVNRKYHRLLAKIKPPIKDRRLYKAWEKGLLTSEQVLEALETDEEKEKWLEFLEKTKPPFITLPEVLKMAGNTYIRTTFGLSKGARTTYTFLGKLTYRTSKHAFRLGAKFLGLDGVVDKLTGNFKRFIYALEDKNIIEMFTKDLEAIASKDGGIEKVTYILNDYTGRYKNNVKNTILDYLKKLKGLYKLLLNSDNEEEITNIRKEITDVITALVEYTKAVYSLYISKKEKDENLLIRIKDKHKDKLSKIGNKLGEYDLNETTEIIKDIVTESPLTKYMEEAKEYLKQLVKTTINETKPKVSSIFDKDGDGERDGNWKERSEKLYGKKDKQKTEVNSSKKEDEDKDSDNSLLSLVKLAGIGTIATLIVKPIKWLASKILDGIKLLTGPVRGVWNISKGIFNVIGKIGDFFFKNKFTKSIVAGISALSSKIIDVVKYPFKNIDKLTSVLSSVVDSIKSLSKSLTVGITTLGSKIRNILTTTNRKTTVISKTRSKVKVGDLPEEVAEKVRNNPSLLEKIKNYAKRIVGKIKSFLSKIKHIAKTKLPPKIAAKVLAKISLRGAPVVGEAMLLMDAGFIAERVILEGQSLPTAISEYYIGIDVFKYLDEETAGKVLDEKYETLNDLKDKENIQKVYDYKSYRAAVKNGYFNPNDIYLTERKTAEEILKSINTSENNLNIKSNLDIKKSILDKIKPVGGFDKKSLISELIRDEGVRLIKYKDKLGYWTIGVGHLLDPRVGGVPLSKIIGKDKDLITPEEAYSILAYDLNNITKNLYKRLPWLSSKPEPVQRELVNMAFNLGVDGLLKFKKALNYIKEDNYTEAAKELIKSKWYHQVGDRAKRIVATLLEVGRARLKENLLRVNSKPNDETTEDTVKTLAKTKVNKARQKTSNKQQEKSSLSDLIKDKNFTENIIKVSNKVYGEGFDNFGKTINVLVKNSEVRNEILNKTYKSSVDMVNLLKELVSINKELLEAIKKNPNKNNYISVIGVNKAVNHDVKNY